MNMRNNIKIGIIYKSVGVCVCECVYVWGKM